jgi:hypothetical protein
MYILDNFRNTSLKLMEYLSQNKYFSRGLSSVIGSTNSTTAHAPTNTPEKIESGASPPFWGVGGIEEFHKGISHTSPSVSELYIIFFLYSVLCIFYTKGIGGKEA